MTEYDFSGTKIQTPNQDSPASAQFKTPAQIIPTATKPETPSQPQPTVEKKPEEKVPFYKKLKIGSRQFNAQPNVQAFTPPPAPVVQTSELPGSPVVTQRIGVQSEEKPKFFSPLKLLILSILLGFMGTITVAATLVATDYTIYSPPDNIKNLLEKIFSGNF